MMKMEKSQAASLRWKILRRALLVPPQQQQQQQDEEDDEESQVVSIISRKSTCPGFNLIPATQQIHTKTTTTTDNDDDVDDELDDSYCVCYTLPVVALSPHIHLFQRPPSMSLHPAAHFQRDIDNTGLVCPWPSEDVLAHFCLSNPHLFASKRVIELGSGYGLAGLVIAAVTDASRVVISDGNPQVLDYVQRSIRFNSPALFGTTQVDSMYLHWNHHHQQEEEQDFLLNNTFDVVVASDCTFFKESHKGLARTLKLLLDKEGQSQALFFSPKRGDSLDKFLVEVMDNDLHFTISDNYDPEVLKRHDRFVAGDDLSWPNYEKDHCYPLLVRITL